jgi:pilus assembly protein Flp/PilA
MQTLLKKLYKDQRGVSVVEYGLIVALIAVGALLAMSAMGTTLQEVFSSVDDDMQLPG